MTTHTHTLSWIFDTLICIHFFVFMQSRLYYSDLFADTWKAFSHYPVKRLSDYAGKKVEEMPTLCCVHMFKISLCFCHHFFQVFFLLFFYFSSFFLLLSFRFVSLMLCFHSWHEWCMAFITTPTSWVNEINSWELLQSILQTSLLLWHLHVGRIWIIIRFLVASFVAHDMSPTLLPMLVLY